MTTDDLAARAAAVGCRVRHARDGDAAALAELIGGVFAEYPGCVLDPDGIDADLHAWASHLTDAGGQGWVLEDPDGRLVACVGVTPTDELPREAAAVGSPAARTVELKRLYVHADVRRSGLGRALVGQVESWARARDAELVVLWSDTRFVDAHRLYTRLGYRQLSARRDLHDPSDTTEAAFLRVLSQQG